MNVRFFRTRINPLPTGRQARGEIKTPTINVGVNYDECGSIILATGPF
jgi:hypothetical protein